jgi:hypothetical protein
MKLLLLLTALLLGCSGSSKPTWTYPNDYDIKLIDSAYVEDFEHNMGVKVEIPIFIFPHSYFLETKQSSGPVIARCEGGRRIVLSDKVFKTAKEGNFDEFEHVLPIVYHELGHCVLRLGHDDRLIAKGMPASWMHPKVHSPPTWKKLGYEYYKLQMINTYKENR